MMAGLPVARAARGVRPRLRPMRRLALLATLVAGALALASTWLPLVQREVDRWTGVREEWTLADGYAWVPLAVELALVLAELVRRRALGWRPLVVLLHLLVGVCVLASVMMLGAAEPTLERGLAMGSHLAVLAVLAVRGLTASARVSYADTLDDGDVVEGEPLPRAVWPRGDG